MECEIFGKVKIGAAACIVSHPRKGREDGAPTVVIATTGESPGHPPVFQKLGLGKSGVATVLPGKSAVSDLIQGYVAFYDGTNTEMSISAAGLIGAGASNQRVKDYFATGVDAATKTPSNPMTTFWDPGYIDGSDPGLLEATILHEALHAYGGYSDDDLKTAFGLGNTGPVAGSRDITNYVEEHCKF